MTLTEFSQTLNMSIYVSRHFCHLPVLLLWPRRRNGAKVSSTIIQGELLDRNSDWHLAWKVLSQRATVALSGSICLVWELKRHQPNSDAPQQWFLNSASSKSHLWRALRNKRNSPQGRISLPTGHQTLLTPSRYRISWSFEPLQEPRSQTALEYRGAKTTGKRAPRDLSSGALTGSIHDLGPQSSFMENSFYLKGLIQRLSEWEWFLNQKALLSIKWSSLKWSHLELFYSYSYLVIIKLNKNYSSFTPILEVKEQKTFQFYICF